jgi:uncharacterized protein YdhG (YjbR/CyaY superfamily)
MWWAGYFELGGQLEMPREIMAKPPPVPANIDEYIAAAAPAARPLLKEIRRVVREAAPDAEELISYRMPAFRQDGILVYFAAFKHHVGVFPPVSGDARLEQAVEPYAGPKGNLRFPMDRPVPYSLIRRIVKLRLKQNMARAPAKATNKPRSGKKPPNNPMQRPASGRR